jgi:hypothetical protein
MLAPLMWLTRREAREPTRASVRSPWGTAWGRMRAAGRRREGAWRAGLRGSACVPPPVRCWTGPRRWVLTFRGAAPLPHKLPQRGALRLALAEVARVAAVLSRHAAARRGVHAAHGRGAVSRHGARCGGGEWTRAAGARRPTLLLGILRGLVCPQVQRASTERAKESIDLHRRYQRNKAHRCQVKPSASRFHGQGGRVRAPLPRRRQPGGPAPWWASARRP